MASMKVPDPADGLLERIRAEINALPDGPVDSLDVQVLNALAHGLRSGGALEQAVAAYRLMLTAIAEREVTPTDGMYDPVLDLLTLQAQALADLDRQAEAADCLAAAERRFTTRFGPRPDMSNFVVEVDRRRIDTAARECARKSSRSARPIYSSDRLRRDAAARAIASADEVRQKAARLERQHRPRAAVRTMIWPERDVPPSSGRVLRALEPFLRDPAKTDFVVLDTDGGFVQFALDADDRLLGEAVSSAYRSERLSEDQHSALLALGWTLPAATGNYIRVWRSPINVDDLASVVVATLAVYGSNLDTLSATYG
jgi:hypothetical protein